MRISTATILAGWAAALGALVSGCYAAHPPLEPIACEPGEACDCRAVDMIPSGVAIVGFGEMTDGCGPGHYGDSPEHRVTLTRPYWLGRYEATAACYLRCIEEGGCTPPTTPFVLPDAAAGGADWNERWFEDPSLGSYPMLPLTWQRAVDYCTWLGGRLPTNAESERALRGDDGRRLPWLLPDEPDRTDCDEATWAGPAERCPENSAQLYFPVDTYPRGRGVFGHFHIADNACEWVQDWYDCYPVEDVVDWSGPPASPIDRRTARCRRGRARQLPDVDVDEDTHRPTSHSVRCAFDVAPDSLRPEDPAP